MEIPASLLMSSGMHAYVAVKGSLHASDSAVFGLSKEEESALTKRFHNYRTEVVNGIIIKGPPIDVVNALGQLGYRVVGSTGEAEIVWTMQRDFCQHGDGCHDHMCSAHHSTSSVYQTLDELDFERGIWHSAQHGDVTRVEKLLKQGIYADQRDAAGYTALHYAARNGHLEICKMLLQHGANIDAATRSGQATALHRACSAGKLDVVHFLLENKASGKMKDSDGKTPLHRAVESQNVEICRVLLSVHPEMKHETDNKQKVPADYIQNESFRLLLD